LKELIGLPSCYNKRKGHYVHCVCVKEIVDLDRAVSYLANVVTMTNKEQDALFNELINSRRHFSADYKIRIGINKINGYSFDLCLNSFLNMIAIGKKRFKSLNDTRHIPGGKNTGNGNACMSNETLQSVVNFIQLKGKQDGEAYATRVIRMLTRNELRDEEKGAVDSPYNTTKRELYEKYCFDRGWDIKSYNMVLYPKVKDCVSHQEDDMFWPSGTVPVEVCSWFSFTDIWKTHCSNIRIRRPCNDTCGECTVSRNAFCCREIRKKAEQSIMDEVEEDDDDLPDMSGRVALDDTTAPLFKDDDVVGEMAKSFLGEDCIERETILEVAGNHVCQAKGMRHFVQHATESAVHCRNEEVTHADREYFIVCYYVRNMPLPHYGGEQPGEIYYFSPLIIISLALLI
jgi:hypothetical protein